MEAIKENQQPDYDKIIARLTATVVERQNKLAKRYTHWNRMQLSSARGTLNLWLDRKQKQL